MQNENVYWWYIDIHKKTHESGLSFISLAVFFLTAAVWNWWEQLGFRFWQKEKWDFIERDSIVAKEKYRVITTASLSHVKITSCSWLRITQFPKWLWYQVTGDPWSYCKGISVFMKLVLSEKGAWSFLRSLVKWTHTYKLHLFGDLHLLNEGNLTCKGCNCRHKPKHTALRRNGSCITNRNIKGMIVQK